MATANSRFGSAGLIPVSVSPDGSLRLLLHRKSGDDHLYDFGDSRMSESTDFTDSVIDPFVQQTYGLFSSSDASPSLWLYRRIVSASTLPVHWSVQRGHVVALLSVPFIDAALLDEASKAHGQASSFFWVTPEEFAVAPLVGRLLVASLRRTVADRHSLLALVHDLWSLLRVQ